MRIDEAKERALDDLIKYAVNEAAKEMAEEMPEPKKVEFSKEHEEKMKKLFKQYSKKKKASFRGNIKKVIIIAAVLTAMLGVSLVSVQAWRVRFINFVMHITDTNTEIRYAEPEESGDTYQTEDVKLGYIPSGFTLSESRGGREKLYLKFANEEQAFALRIRIGDSIMNVDTEDADTRKIKVGDKEIFLTEKDDNYTLSWSQSEKAYTLNGNMPEEELLKIAEKIE